MIMLKPGIKFINLSNTFYTMFRCFLCKNNIKNYLIIKFNKIKLLNEKLNNNILKIKNYFKLNK